MNQSNPISKIRHFNRFYTRHIGLLKPKLYDNPFPLSENRVIFELAQHQEATATTINQALELDPGYLSRILRAFEKKGLINRRPCPEDGRQSLISLTEAGYRIFDQINETSDREVGRIVKHLNGEQMNTLLCAMQTIEELMHPSPRAEEISISEPEPGDLGWVLETHARIYSRDYGWGPGFEKLVARVIHEYLEDFSPGCYKALIARKGQNRAGSVFITREDQKTARLRLLLVTPEARGSGIGQELVNQAIRFAQNAGYQKLRLWTNSCLHSARKIYEAAGFSLLNEEPHDLFGQGLIGQTWELSLA